MHVLDCIESTKIRYNQPVTKFQVTSKYLYLGICQTWLFSCESVIPQYNKKHELIAES